MALLLQRREQRVGLSSPRRLERRQDGDPRRSGESIARSGRRGHVVAGPRTCWPRPRRIGDRATVEFAGTDRSGRTVVKVALKDDHATVRVAHRDHGPSTFNRQNPESGRHHIRACATRYEPDRHRR